ncbi:MAG: hypothetical protein FD177_996 [Desulfovibrionaceae bacterium]|nr:MAG: hypothetical protein FD177_996 [Desulfovibrionaceae bacterium]
MSKKPGAKFKVTLGASTVVGMGSVQLNGIAIEQLETTAFGDEWKQFIMGMKDGGELNFSGFFDPDDSTGQEVLRVANLNATDITNLRVYYDQTSYYELCQTTGYFSPTLTSNQKTQKSYLNITSWDVNADKSSVSTSSFKAKISGCFVRV